jgi:glycosyltransferase involved in cell wall biosynthesis/SAM-dependent methyltransferase
VTALRILAVADVSPLTVVGGGERVLWEQMRRLAHRGHDVRVLCRSAAASPAPPTVREGVEIVEFAPARRSAARFVQTTVTEARRAAARLLAARDADVLNVYQPLSGYGVLASAAGRRRPALYSFLSPAPLEYRSRRRMTKHHLGGVAGLAGLTALWLTERACLQRAARIHVMSDFSRSLLWKLHRVPSERLVHIGGGVDLARFRPAPDRRAVRAGLGLALDRPLLFTVRNLEARMGLDTLIEAMARLVRRRPDALLLIGGSGSQRPSLEEQVVALGLDKHVTFLGFVPDGELPRYYQAADVFVLPTRELEGFGLVTAEALACGTPVLGTPVGATPELLDPLEAGLVFEAATAEAMATDLSALLDRLDADAAGGERLRAACRRHAETCFDWERIVDALETTLVELAARRPLPTAPAPTCETCSTALARTGLLYEGRRYHRCADCGARRVAALPSESDTLGQYRVRYPRRFPPEQITPARRLMLTSVAARLRGLARPGRLLDVGFGGGHLMAAVRADGWRPLGVDVSHAACVVARGGAPVVQASAEQLPFRAGTLDAVALVNVLDHARCPRAVIQEAARALRPGGLLVVRVPNGAVHSWATRALGHLGPWVRWRGLDTFPILHLFAFGPVSLRRLVEGAGFEVVSVVNSGLGARRLARAVGSAVAGTVRALSGRRWLIGPSIELYARRRAAP